MLGKQVINHHTVQFKDLLSGILGMAGQGGEEEPGEDEL